MFELNEQQFDTIIKNGSIVDGSGRNSYVADLAIKDGKIAAMGDLAGAKAPNIIDAPGLLVTPGFIDIHTHSDATLLIDPRAESQIRQGVTTEVIGQCGTSLAPCSDETRNSGLLKMFGTDLGTWNSFAEYLEVMDSAKTATNVVGIVGHGTLREVVMGPNQPRLATDEEIADMVSLLAKSLEEGAFGMSTGLEYHPGKLAGYD